MTFESSTKATSTLEQVASYLGRRPRITNLLGDFDVSNAGNPIHTEDANPVDDTDKALHSATPPLAAEYTVIVSSYDKDKWVLNSSSGEDPSDFPGNVAKKLAKKVFNHPPPDRVAMQLETIIRQTLKDGKLWKSTNAEIRTTLNQGWLLHWTTWLFQLWNSQCCLWCWEMIFSWPWLHEADSSGDKVKIVRPRAVDDALWIAVMVLSVLLFLLFAVFLTPENTTNWWPTVLIAMIAYRVFDIGIQYTGNFLMIWAHGGRFDKTRFQRRVLFVLFDYVGLMFLFAATYWWLANVYPNEFSSKIAAPQQALHLSMATATTIGYGTFAPVGWLSVAICCIQALLVVLIVMTVFVQSFSILAASPVTTEPSNPFLSYVSKSELLRRYWLPPTVTLGFVMVVWLSLMYFSSDIAGLQVPDRRNVTVFGAGNGTIGVFEAETGRVTFHSHQGKKLSSFTLYQDASELPDEVQGDRQSESKSN